MQIQTEIYAFSSIVDGSHSVSKVGDRFPNAPVALADIVDGFQMKDSFTPTSLTL